MTIQGAPLLEVRGLTKTFGGVEALVNVDFIVNRHEVVALVGDNAAGKSTLARTLSGVFPPDEGTIALDGEEISIDSPQHALKLGIATVFQETALCDNLDVVSNIFLGREVFSHRALDDEGMELKARQYLDQLGSHIPDVTHPRLVILDEPTASMSVAQTAEVLILIEHLRDMGMGVIYISHNLTDVQASADRIEVLRHGHNNGSFDSRYTSTDELIAAITGASHIAL